MHVTVLLLAKLPALHDSARLDLLQTENSFAHQQVRILAILALLNKVFQLQSEPHFAAVL